MSLDILWKAELPRTAPPTAGIGRNGDIFPANYPIIFDMRKEKGMSSYWLCAVTFLRGFKLLHVTSDIRHYVLAVATTFFLM